MLLTDENYYSKEADSVYMSCSQYKTWTQCEALGFAKYVSGEYEKLEQSGVISRDKTALIMGNFVGTKWESEDAHEQFKIDEKRNILVSPTSEVLKNKLLSIGVDFKKSAKKPELLILCSQNSINIDKLHTLKSEYKLGELMYERTVKDPLFKRSMTGEHEKIITFEMFGVKWKCRLDLINLDNKCITDLKTTQNFKEIYGNVHGQQGYLPFYEIWRYPLQLAIYQKAGLIEYGITFDMFISVVTKEKIPNFDVLDFDATEWDDRFKYELDLIETNLPRILKVKNKKDMPERCEECEYCIATKVLIQPTIVHSYFNIPEDEDFELDLNN